MRRMLIALAGLALLAGACSTSPDDRVALAESIGRQLSERLQAPLAAAAGDPATWEDQDVGDLLVGTIHELPLPDDVRDLIPGDEQRGGLNDDGFGFVGTAIAVFRETEPHFCIVVSLGSDGQVVARPVVADPLDRCRSAEIPNLLEPAG